MNIKRGTAKLYQLLQQSFLQHSVFGVIISVLFFLHFWHDCGRNFDIAYIRQAFLEALTMMVLMGIPVYLNLRLVYSQHYQIFFGKNPIPPPILKGWGFYIFLVLSSIFALIGGYIISWLIYPIFCKWDWQLCSFTLLTLILCTSGIEFSIKGIERVREIGRLQRRTEALMLGALKRQISPHFLVNLLTNFQILAKRKDNRLPELIARLSSLLRYIVYETKAEMVSVQKEIDFLKDYIELQRLSLPKGADFQFEVENNSINSPKIATTLLLIFVENSFKHCKKSPNEPTFIHIRIVYNDNFLSYEGTNSALKKRYYRIPLSSEKRGIGLTTAQDQLTLLYKDEYQLNTKNENGIYSIKIKLPLR